MPKINGYQNHHVISRSMSNHPALKAAGFNIDAPENLIYLPKEVGIHPTRSIHNGWNKVHYGYNMEMRNKLDAIAEKGRVKGWGQEQYASEVEKLRNNTRQSLRKGRIKCN